MSQVAQMMTRGVRSMAPTDMLQLAAQAMEELDVGALPICDGDRVVGVVTDRDITIRGVAHGMPVDRTPVREVMSTDITCVHEDDSMDEVLDKMQGVQVRRLPVLDRQDRLVGMLSLGDLAAKGNPEEAGDALSDISQPARPDRSSQSAASGAAGGGSSSGQRGGQVGGQGTDMSAQRMP